MVGICQKTSARDGAFVNLFSLNEQQKVYYINQGCMSVPQGMKKLEEVGEGLSWLASVFNYHLMQIFLPFHWPTAHHVTCK